MFMRKSELIVLLTVLSFGYGVQKTANASERVIQKEEIAYRSGDLIVAENVITKERRIINPSLRESNTNKRILKG